MATQTTVEGDVDVIENAVTSRSAAGTVTSEPKRSAYEEAVPGPRRRPLGDGWLVALVALAVGAAGWWFAQTHGLTMLYGDARSHLSIARRLVDGPNHGIVQLGTVWLPLSHLLMAPLSLVQGLWDTGGAGALLGTICLAVEAVSVSVIVRCAGGKRLAAWCAVLFLLGNPSWLYLHATAMAEPVTLATILWTLAATSRWVSDKRAWSGGQVALYIGLPSALAVWSRYDGWSFAGVIGVFIAFVAWRRWGKARYALKIAACYAALPSLAAGWWLWFNGQHFGDPLDFWRGKWSAQAQQAALEKLGELPDKGSVTASVVRYAWATWDCAGAVIVVGSVLGMLLWAYKSRGRLVGLTPWIAVVVPVVFHIASLYRGEIAIRLTHAGDKSLWNIRYGAQALPGLAIFCGLAIAVLAGDLLPPLIQAAKSRRERRDVERVQARRDRRRLVAGMVGIVAVVAAAGLWWPNWQQVPVIREGLEQKQAGRHEWAGALWLKEHAHEGVILIDDSTHPMLPPIGTNYDRVLAPFSGPEYDRALRDPDGSRARWIYEQKGSKTDQVARAMAREDHSDFEIAYRSGDVYVWERKGRR